MEWSRQHPRDLLLIQRPSEMVCNLPQDSFLNIFIRGKLLLIQTKPASALCNYAEKKINLFILKDNYSSGAKQLSIMWILSLLKSK